MNISSLFIKRPIATAIIMAALVIFGVIGYRFLPVSDLPNVDFPTIMVSASLPGASPETMASTVATPLEREFSTIAAIDSMSSTNTLGKTQITIQFNLNRNIDAAAQDVQSAISKAQRSLPTDMPTPPSSRKVNPADIPIFFLALSSPTLPLSLVDEYAETYLAQRISMISGVAQVMVFGSQKYAVRVQLSPWQLFTRKIGLGEISDAIDKANQNLPSGDLEGLNRSFIIQTFGQMDRAAYYNDLVVAYRNGSAVRLQDLGKAVDSVENDKTAGWYNRNRSVVLAIQRQPGTNTVEIADSIRKMLPAFRAQLPAALSLNVLFDRSNSIRNSVRDVKFTLLLALCLVVLVIFLFLRNVTATFIPSIALPISIIGTFSVMFLLGFSLDNMSLMALTLSVGFVVDDAIVMLENIVRHIELGESPLEAAFSGSKEIGFTILSMTLSLMAVFIPVLFMGGLLGRLLNEFAVTISCAILVSGIVSLTLTPMLCSRLLKPEKSEKRSAFYLASERIFQQALDFYRSTLQTVLKHRRFTLGLSFFILLLVFYLFAVMPKGFLPSEDNGQLFGSTEGAQGISYEAMVRHQQALADLIAKDPNVDAFMSSVSNNSSGRFFIRLKPRKLRKLSADQVVQELRVKLSKEPDIQIFLQNPPPINIGGMMSKSLYQYTLQSTETADLYQASAKMEAALRDLPGLQDVTSDLRVDNPQINVKLKRDKASALGITVQQIESALFDAFGTRQVSTILTPSNEYQVIVELAPQYQLDPQSLKLIYVKSASGQMVPLEAVADLEAGYGPLSVTHLGQLPAVTLSFNLKPGYSLGDAVSAIQKLSQTVLPTNVIGSFQGSAQAFKSSMGGLGVLLLIAILVIYFVLGILYESLIHPLTILSGLPSAGVGALLTLLLFHKDLDIYAFVGIIMLIGIVKKNAIMMIDFALRAQREENKSPEEAIVEGCLVRFRPIMMTTMAALFGTLPIAMGIGAGAESRQPLGLAVVGGLIFSQLITLYLTPVIYLYMEKFQSRMARSRRRGEMQTAGN